MISQPNKENGHEKNKRIFGKELSNIIGNQNYKTLIIPKERIPLKPVIQSMPYVYTHSTFAILKKIETRTLPKPGFIKCQKEISTDKRQVLLNWLANFHFKCNLLPETFHLAVSLIDEYLQIKEIQSTKFQLLGLSAMVIACKFEEIIAPIYKDFEEVMGGVYTIQEIMQMEMAILHEINFKVVRASSWRFLQYYWNEMALSRDCRFYLSQYLIEVSLLSEDIVCYRPSLVAIASLYLAVKLLNIPIKLTSLTEYKQEEIDKVATQICSHLHYINDQSEFNVLKKKFSTSHYYGVSSFSVEANQCIS